MTTRELARSITQPRGGYIPIGKYFKKVELYGMGSAVSSGKENIPQGLMELAVKRNSECRQGFSEHIFDNAYEEAIEIRDGYRYASLLKEASKGNTDAVIKLCAYEYWGRTYGSNMEENIEKIRETSPNTLTNRRVDILTDRVMAMLGFNRGNEISIDIILSDIRSNKVKSVSVDYISDETMWILKTNIQTPNKVDSLQVFMNYQLSRKSSRSGEQVIRNCHKVGIINPRIGTLWICNALKVDIASQCEIHELLEIG